MHARTIWLAIFKIQSNLIYEIQLGLNEINMYKITPKYIRYWYYGPTE